MQIAFAVMSLVLCCLSLLWLTYLYYIVRWNLECPLIVTRLFSTPARVQKVLIYSLMTYVISAISTVVAAFLVFISS